MGRRSHPPPAQIRIGIICENEHTADALLDYLGQVGVPARRLLELRPPLPHDWAAMGLQALVIFPDDFAAPFVDRLLAEVTDGTPRILQLIVTRHPQRFTTARGQPLPQRCVLPRPIFGWHILDALRESLEG